jgi:hypothetical protein
MLVSPVLFRILNLRLLCLPRLGARLTHLTCSADSGNLQTCSRIYTASTNANWVVKRRFKTKHGSHLQTTNIETSATVNPECATEGWGVELGYACFWRRLQAERGEVFGVRALLPLSSHEACLSLTDTQASRRSLLLRLYTSVFTPCRHWRCVYPNPPRLGMQYC